MFKNHMGSITALNSYEPGQVLHNVMKGGRSCVGTSDTHGCVFSFTNWWFDSSKCCICGVLNAVYCSGLYDDRYFCDDIVVN